MSDTITIRRSHLLSVVGALAVIAVAFWAGQVSAKSDLASMPEEEAGLVAAVYARPAATARRAMATRAAAPVRHTSPAAPTSMTSVAQRTSEPVDPVRPEGRSWKTTALVIGGSTGAGAGIGAIAGGKKGALIGAALGGGGAAIFEAIKRR